MKNPQQEIIPMWYDLGVDGTDLLVYVHQKAADSVKRSLTKSSPIVPALQKELNLPDFILPTEGKWGFGEILSIQQGITPDWITWKCPLPIILGPESGPRGNWQGAFAVSATLQVLFTALAIADEETDSSLQQLLVVDGWLTRSGMNGGSLIVIVCPPLCSWLSQQEDNSTSPEICAAMKRTDEHMRGQKWSFGDSDFRAWFRQPKWINLDCPGEACGLDPVDYYNLSLERGYDLAPHNVDSPLQQLTLLSGLAALCQLARGEKVH